MTYPLDWPMCVECGAPVLYGHLTCGRAECDEARARGARMVSESKERLNKTDAAARGGKAVEVRLLDPQPLDVETIQREFKRTGKEIRRWRLLFDAVVREVESLRRARRIAQRFSAEKARKRQTQFAALGVTSVDELIFRIHATQGWDRLATGQPVVAECEVCIRKGLLPSKAIACYCHSGLVAEEYDRLRSGLRNNNLRAMLLHLLDDQKWGRIHRPGCESFTREDARDILRLLRDYCEPINADAVDPQTDSTGRPIPRVQESS